ncbi:MAG TPA: ABC transporter permease subunit [Actinocrinis sp.]|nr:ABC transporter permease subunit [Actinocrinis sp.]
MTAATPTIAPAPARRPVKRVGMREALDSEWAKIITVRSTYWTALATLIIGVGLSILLSFVLSDNLGSMTAENRAKIDISYTMIALDFAMLAVGVLGVLVISSEYASGMIRTSLTALPRRGVLLSAKAAVLAVVAAVCGLIVAWGSYLGSEPLWSAKGIRFDLNANGNLRAVFGAALGLMLVSLFGFAVGALVRHTAGSVAIVVGMYFVVPIITSFLPDTWGKDVNKLMPSNAAHSMVLTYHDPGSLTPLNGLLVLLLWIVVPLGVAFVLFKRRDA